MPKPDKDKERDPQLTDEQRIAQTHREAGVQGLTELVETYPALAALVTDYIERSSIGRLVNEEIRIILYYLPKKDIASFLLTNKRSGELALSVLCPEQHVYIKWKQNYKNEQLNDIPAWFVDELRQQEKDLNTKLNDLFEKLEKHKDDIKHIFEGDEGAVEKFFEPSNDVNTQEQIEHYVSVVQLYEDEQRRGLLNRVILPEANFHKKCQVNMLAVNFCVISVIIFAILAAIIYAVTVEDLNTIVVVSIAFVLSIYMLMGLGALATCSNKIVDDRRQANLSFDEEKRRLINPDQTEADDVEEAGNNVVANKDQHEISAKIHRFLNGKKSDNDDESIESDSDDEIEIVVKPNTYGTLSRFGG